MVSQASLLQIEVFQLIIEHFLEQNMVEKSQNAVKNNLNVQKACLFKLSYDDL